MKKILFFCFLAAGCSGNSPQETVTFDDVTPDSKKEYQEEKIELVDTSNIFTVNNLTDLSKEFTTRFVEKDSRISTWDTLLFPDRFQSQNKEKWKANFGKDSLVFASWEFKDSIQSKNAFYNWLDCFGSTCKSVELNTDKRIQKIPFFILLTDKRLLFVESKKKLKLDELHLFFTENLKLEKQLFWIQQENSGKVKWIKSDEWNKLQEK